MSRERKGEIGVVRRQNSNRNASSPRRALSPRRATCMNLVHPPVPLCTSSVQLPYPL